MTEPLRYRLLGCLGEGGFGVVYRARLEGPEGFVKDVAIKLLRDADAPERAIARFRDEARILGLVRDRAIVTVDPPVQLDGHWALVMEYVDGVSCRWLLDRGPVLAPKAALELCAEVARALDVAVHQHGPDGQPLELLHRDLKPANLQLTPTGQVKILDFGIGKARFEAREAHTTRGLAGTAGYIAPERLAGHDGPAADIFSLGVVLHELITGVRGPSGSAEPTFEEGDPDPDALLPLDDALLFGRAMRSPSPADRPTAREVEQRCLELAAQSPGTGLRDWAAEHVPDAPPSLPDARVGQVLTVGTTLRDTPPASARPPGATAAPALHRADWALPALVMALTVVAFAVWRFVPDHPAPLAQALEQPFADFVVEPDVARSERSGLRDPSQWDHALYTRTVEHTERLAADPDAIRRLDQQWAAYRDVVLAVRDTGLPEVLAGIPWVESGYRPELQSTHCAKGLWQLMPESAVRAREVHGVDLKLADCDLGDGQTFTPTALAPPVDLAPYVVDGQCAIPARNGCRVDDRTDPTRATAAALSLMRGAWDDPDLAASGAVVQATLASQFFGHDDGTWGAPKPFNLRPAFLAWAPTVPEAQHPTFLTAAGTDLNPRTADLVARALAAHFVAVCYYAANYPEEPAFRDWSKYPDGYCRSLDLPSRSALAH